jgi:alpha-tubulin suppressor-like RCC1 family protein
MAAQPSGAVAPPETPVQDAVVSPETTPPADPLDPTAAPALGESVSLAAGNDYTCALLKDGTVHCWGSNSVDQLGNRSGVPRSTAATVVDVSEAVGITAGEHH